MPDDIDDITPLIVRGRAMLARHYAALPVELRPIGGATLDVVHDSDFADHAMACLRHVVRHGKSLHIMCSDGTICALLERLTVR